MSETPSEKVREALAPCPFCPGPVDYRKLNPDMMVHVGWKGCVLGASQFPVKDWNRRALPLESPAPGLREAARDLHYRLIEECGLPDDPPNNAKARALIQKAISISGAPSKKTSGEG